VSVSGGSALAGGGRRRGRRGASGAAGPGRASAVGHVKVKPQQRHLTESFVGSVQRNGRLLLKSCCTSKPRLSFEPVKPTVFFLLHLSQNIGSVYSSPTQFWVSTHTNFCNFLHSGSIIFPPTLPQIYPLHIHLSFSLLPILSHTPAPPRPRLLPCAAAPSASPPPPRPAPAD
jgi:hypothetical protein